jgi:ankyrin repeat protein
MGLAQSLSESDVEDIFSFARHERCADIERMLDRGIPINVRDEYGNTLLTIACQNGSKRVAKIVLRRGADINSRNHKGNTPLHYCFQYGYGDSLGEYLISKGADPSVRNNAGRTCYDVAA